MEKVTKRGALTALFASAIVVPAAAKAALKAESVNLDHPQGYGACSTSGCPCRGYTGNQQLCTNCGHNYTQHW
jgi:hypothetical protein